MPRIVTVAAYKGGVGKTTLALELAYLLDAPLIDLDWDKGGATKRWGYRGTETSPLLDAIERGRVPRPRKGHGKPDLVPGDRDLEANQPEVDVMSETLEKWAAAWARRYVVVDTHPGGSPATLGAMNAASVVLTPTVLASGELDGLEGLVEETADYPLLVVPNKVPRVPDQRLTKRLKDLATRYELAVGPVVSEYRRLPKRTTRMTISALDPAPKAWERYAQELRAVAEAVKTYSDG
jgi:chromosome partitioning protein